MFNFLKTLLFLFATVSVVGGADSSWAIKCPDGDFNEDYEVNSLDLSIFGGEWLAPALMGPFLSDIDENGEVNYFDYSVLAENWLGHAYPVDSLTTCYQQAAQYILSQVDFTQGYCFVFGCGEGRLAYEIGIRSNLNILGVDDNDSKVDSGRALLHGQDIYGDRITLQKGSLDTLKYRDYIAVLVVSDSIIEDGVCSGSAAEMFRMVRPDGGVALIGQPAGCPNVLSRTNLETWLDAGGLTYTITEDSNGIWARINRGPLPGAGEWTHTWANISNTACSGDTRTTDSAEVLWFGEPGPRLINDRHWRPAGPLYKAGRMIVIGDNHLYCSDAYNGAKLWDLAIPDSTRIAILRDAGWVVVDSNYIFAAAADGCHKIDFDTGQVLDTYQPPTTGKDWGYVGIDGDLLIGSSQMEGASRLAIDYYSGGTAGNQIARLDNQPTVVSEGLFCRNRETGALLWTYDSSDGLGGNPFVIANPTICAGGDYIYFFESYEAAAVSDSDARVTPATFCNGSNEYLVKLNKNTGTLVWREQHDLPFANIIYLSYANEIALASGCTTGVSTFRYHYRAFDTTDGSLAWQKDWDSTHNSGDKEHGGQDKHPMIIGDDVYLKFGCYNLQTGNTLNRTFVSSNCADFAASANHLFSRNSSRATLYNINAGGSGAALCSAMRPGCYISIMPAGGIIMLPAHSAGCTCGHTLQTTIAWLPE
ncbi:MAG: PQQ-binding-like beta-propeller repeat protein [Sedimentisphaerales bacterium]|nr:PQQ-binding-like beta-propeller repeat protein [Sedimentisphaerales bacterium]